MLYPLLYFVLILLVILALYLNRNQLKKYFNKEMSAIEDLNQYSEEVNSFVTYYSKLTSEELTEKINSEDLRKNEQIAIKKVLQDRQAPPHSGTF